jgi:hypothetical protein
MKMILVLASLCAGCAGQVAPDKTDVADRYCVRETGTRMARPDGQCTPDPGRSYTREDLERTGESTLGGALSRVRPW